MQPSLRPWAGQWVCNGLCYPLGFDLLLFFSFLLTHGYTVELGLSYLHKILCNNGYCFKSSSLLCAVGLYIKCLNPQCLPVITKLILLRYTV